MTPMRRDDELESLSLGRVRFEFVTTYDTGSVGEKFVTSRATQIRINGDGTVTMPEWLAKEKGLI